MTVPRETSLAETEATEQRIQYVLDPGSTGQPVEGRSRMTEIFGGQNRITRLCCRPDRPTRFIDQGRLPAIQGFRALAREERLCPGSNGLEQILDPFLSDRRDGNSTREAQRSD